MFYDSHAHLSGPALLPQASVLLERARSAGVDRILNICTDPSDLEAGLELQRLHPHVLNAGATTPHDVQQEGEQAFARFEEAARLGQLVAIGETGLDYHYEHSDRATQQRFLVRYLHLAATHRLPVIFHCREAFSDLFSIVDAEYPRAASAVLHCFTGTEAEAEEVWRRGWHLSLSGIVTFKKSEALRAIARKAPLHQLLIETDSPYLAPQSRRGQQNEPAFIAETAACIAAVRGVSVSEIAEATRANAMRLFDRSWLLPPSSLR